MLRKLMGVFGLVFAVGCCCVRERVFQKPAQESASDDYGKVNLQEVRWDFVERERSKNRESLQTEEKIHGGIGP